MEEIRIIKDKKAVLVSIERWEKIQNELVRLKKRLKKADVLNDIKKSLVSLKRDLKNKKYRVGDDLTADDFLVELRNEQ
jgi:hypothetical protein